MSVAAPHRSCSVDGCERAYLCSGYCEMHYRRVRRNGEPLEVRWQPIGHWRERISVDDATGCWNWTGYISPSGYGEWGGRNGAVHRLVYRDLVGPIADGMHLDHLCRNTRCCNPAHLEPVTRAENILRGVSPAALNAQKMLCKRGHPLSGENLYIEPGRGARRCRQCTRDRQRAARLNERERNL